MLLNTLLLLVCCLLLLVLLAWSVRKLLGSDSQKQKQGAIGLLLFFLLFIALYSL
jgi:flagellar biogenesis protein FliO